MVSISMLERERKNDDLNCVRYYGAQDENRRRRM